MNRYYFKIIAAIILLISSVQISQAAGLYSKPEFRGRVIDAETKEPLEGAVVVFLYDRWPIIGGPGGPNSYIFHAKETLTDSKGEFNIPSFSSFILSSLDAGIRFIFYKPGYMASYGRDNISPTLIESYFSAGKIGEEKEIEGGTFEQGSYVKWKGPLGIVELKRATTREEKLRTMPSPPTDFTSKELPILIKIINEEGKNLGLKGEYK